MIRKKVYDIKHLKNCPEFVAGDKSHLREILNPKKANLKINYSLAWAKVAPGEKTLPHKLKATEVYFIIKGDGRMHINNEEELVRRNDSVHIPPDAVQYIENIGKGNLEFLCIVDPAWQPTLERIIDKC